MSQQVKKKECCVVQVLFRGNRGSELLSYLLEGGEVEMHFGRNSERVVFESKIPGLWATGQEWRA